MLENAIKEAQLLGIFKSICDNNSSTIKRRRLKNIIALTDNKIETIKIIVNRDYNIELNDKQANRLLELLNANFKKCNYRKQLDYYKKIELLIKQDYKCAICNCDIHQNYHADHIIPFKYVGDALDNNWQILCSRCNKKKKESFDYQIRYLLNLI